VDELVPAGFSVRPDPGTRLLPGGPRLAGGAVLVGGSPVRVLRLTASGARQVAAWLDGTPVPGGAAARRLARRLLDAGLAHPAFDPATASSAPRALGQSDVTVVIPVRDRHDELARCLAGLREATGPVIVVDDCSADPAAIAAIAAAAGARVIRRPVNGGPGAARNTGLAAATTKLVAFLDSDCVPAPGWLDALLPHFADPVTGAVAPRIVPAVFPRGDDPPVDPPAKGGRPPFDPPPQGNEHRTLAPGRPGAPSGRPAGQSWLARYEGASSTLDMGARPSIVRPGARVSYVPGAALLVRRDAAGDGFQAGMRVGEDVDFVWRLAAAGWRTRYEPAAVMAHQHRVQLRAWFSRRVDYGTSAALLEELHPGDVRPMYASWWTVGAWAAALAIRPRGAGAAAAAVVTATATTLLARRLSRVTGETWPLPARPAVAWRLAARLAGGGTLAAARPLGSALSRTWWPAAIPLALAVPRLRGPAAALVIAPPLLDWVARRPPLDPARYVAARLLDDAAYGVGVWTGCARRRQFRALAPVIGSRPARSAPGG
jgi:GT2 family glycosyltransferase